MWFDDKFAATEQSPYFLGFLRIWSLIAATD